MPQLESSVRPTLTSIGDTRYSQLTRLLIGEEAMFPSFLSLAGTGLAKKTTQSWFVKCPEHGRDNDQRVRKAREINQEP